MTPRYLAKHDHDEWAVSDESQVNQYRDHYFIFHGTEAEAEIIAWALTAVAAGLVLQAFHDFEDLDFAMAYDGPTDGVAPSESVRMAQFEASDPTMGGG